MAATAEMPTIKMQIVDVGGGSKRIDFEPPLTDEQKGWIGDDHVLYDFPPEAFAFRDLTPDEGKPFTEIDCEKAREVLGGSKMLVLDELSFARAMGDILTKHGAIVRLDEAIKPIEESGYLFLGLTATRPE